MAGDTHGVSLVCCDLAGIVIEGSVVERAFAEAIATQGLVSGTQSYTRAMVMLDHAHGRPPGEVMRELFDGDEARAAAGTVAFDQSFRDTADRFGVNASAGVVDALGKIAATGPRVCLLTSLSRGASGTVIEGLRRQGLAAYQVLTADDSPRGFPWPDPVLSAMLRFGAGDVREVAVISATECGVQSGHRAGAGTVIGIADGVRRAAALHGAGATHVVDSVDAFPYLVASAA